MHVYKIEHWYKNLHKWKKVVKWNNESYIIFTIIIKQNINIR